MMSFRRFRVWTAIPLVGVLIGVTGCGADTGSTKPPSPTDEAAQAVAPEKAVAADARADRPDGPRGHGPGGPDHLLMAALHELDLTDAQKTTIQAAMDKLALPARPARGERGDHGPRDTAAFTTLAAGVRAGKIDTATLLAGAPDRGPEARGAEVATALQTLHATLTKEQRRALVDSMAKRMADHGPPDGAPPPDKGDRDHDREHGPGGPEGGPMGHLLGGLSLTAAQRTSIDAALAAQRPAAGDRDAMKKQFEARGAQMRARMESFASDTFDAKAFVAPPADAPQGAMMNPMARMVNELAVVVPLLDATQRETLAAQLEKGPPAPMMGRPGGRGAR
jgi:Spy/CpxP family protein refolding chaperone